MTQAAAQHGVDVQVMTRDPGARGFKPLPLRWRIEATFGTLGNRWHRLTRNLEQSPAAAEDAVSIRPVITRVNEAGHVVASLHPSAATEAFPHDSVPPPS